MTRLARFAAYVVAALAMSSATPATTQNAQRVDPLDALIANGPWSRPMSAEVKALQPRMEAYAEAVGHVRWCETYLSYGRDEAGSTSGALELIMLTAAKSALAASRPSMSNPNDEAALYFASAHTRENGISFREVRTMLATVRANPGSAEARRTAEVYVEKVAQRCVAFAENPTFKPIILPPLNLADRKAAAIEALSAGRPPVVQPEVRNPRPPPIAIPRPSLPLAPEARTQLETATRKWSEPWVCTALLGYSFDGIRDPSGVSAVLLLQALSEASKTPAVTQTDENAVAQAIDRAWGEAVRVRTSRIGMMSPVAPSEAQARAWASEEARACKAAAAKPQFQGRLKPTLSDDEAEQLAAKGLMWRPPMGATAPASPSGSR